MSILDLGWLGDLVAQHLYDENDTPFPQRRGWRIIIDATIGAATIVDNTEKGTLDIRLPAGEVGELPDTIVMRDELGRARVVGALGSADAPLTLETQGGQPIEIKSGAGIDLALGAEGDVLRILAGVAERLTVTPGSSVITIDALTDALALVVGSNFEIDCARDVIFDYADSRSFIVNEGGLLVFRVSSSNGTELRSNVDGDASLSLEGDATTLAADSDVTVDAGVILDLIAGGLRLRLSNDGSGNLKAEAHAPIDLRPAQVGAGVGHKTTIGGGPGASGSLAGDLDIQGGALVGGNTAPINLYTLTTLLCQIRGTLSTYTEISHKRTNSALLLRALETGAQVWIQANNRALIRVENAAAGFVDTAATLSRRYTASEGALFYSDVLISTALTLTGTQTIATIAFTASRVWRVCVIVTWSNDTDKTGGSAVLVGTFTSHPGAETQVGVSFIDSNHFRSSDAGIASTAAFDLSYSVNTVRVRVNPSTAKARNFNVEFVQNERVIT